MNILKKNDTYAVYDDASYSYGKLQKMFYEDEGESLVKVLTLKSTFSNGFEATGIIEQHNHALKF